MLSPESNVAPTIYLNNFYEKYEDGTSLESILSEIADIRVSHEVDKNMDVSNILEFDNVKDKIIPRLVGIENNDKFLENRPFSVVEDLAIVYCIDLGEDEKGVMSIPISNELMDNWGVDVDTLKDVAIKNLPEITPSKFRSMAEVMREMMLPNMIDNFGGDREAAEEVFNDMMPVDDMMYILSNEKSLNGATALLDDSMMEQVAEKVGNLFYILPSSTHECIIVPNNPGMDLATLEDMVQTVNATEVAPQDKLSDHVYMYDNDTKEIFRADKLEEHLQNKENSRAESSKDVKKDISEKSDKKISLKGRLEEKKNVVKELDKKTPAKEISKNRNNSL